MVIQRWYKILLKWNIYFKTLINYNNDRRILMLSKIKSRHSNVIRGLHIRKHGELENDK